MTMLYLVSGCDSFRVKERTAAILEAHEAVKKEFRSGELREAIAAASSPTLLGNIGAVYSTKALKPEEGNELTRLAERDLVYPLVLEVETLDARTKITKVLRQRAQCSHLDPIQPWDVAALKSEALTRSRHLGMSLSLECIEYFVSAIGNDLGRMQQELRLLSIYAPTATLERMQEAIPNLSQSAFEIADAILNGEGAHTLTLCQELRRRNVHALEILGAVAFRFERWLKVRAAVDGGITDIREIAKCAEVRNPQQVVYLQREVQRLPFDRAVRILVGLRDLQHQCKRGLDADRLPMKITQLALTHASE